MGMPKLKLTNAAVQRLKAPPGARRLLRCDAARLRAPRLWADAKHAGRPADLDAVLSLRGQAEAPERLTLARLIETWRLAREGERRPRYVAEVVRRLRQTLAPMLDMDAASISPGEAVLALDRIKRDSGGTTSNRALSYARGCYSWAVRRRMLASNPFAGIERPARETAREVLQTTPRFARCPLVFTTNQRSQVSGFSTYKAALDRGLAAMGTPLAPWTLARFPPLGRRLARRGRLPAACL